MEKDDILIHYIVHKKEGTKKIKIKTLIHSIITYIQTHEVYFKYEPDFYAGVLIFGIIGLKKDHNKLKKNLGKIFDRLGCQVQYVDGNIDGSGKNNAIIEEVIKRFS